MKYQFYYIICSMIIPVFTACSTDERDISEAKVYTIHALMPEGNPTRTSVELNAASLSLIPRWLPSDEISLFARSTHGAGGDPQSIGKNQVSNISADGKSCEFPVQFPDDLISKGEDNTAEVEVYGVCGKEGVVNDYKNIVFYANLVRTTIADFIVPVWFKFNFKKSFLMAQCQHLGTYELLHIRNTGKSDISFFWKNFESTSDKWYYENAAFYPIDEVIKENRTPSDKDIFPIKAIALIPAGKEAVLISWYIPTGKKVNDAVLVAEIDGKEVKSNPKSSNANIKVGRAYHFYAEWDGKNLYLDSFEDGIFSTLDDVPNHEL